MKKQIIIISAVALLTFVGGYFLGRSQSTLNRVANQGDEKPRIDSTLPTAESAEIKALSGVVKDFSGDIIVLEISESEFSASSELAVRTVEVSADTKIFFQEPKDLIEFQKEIEEYNKKMQEQTANQPKSGKADVAQTDSLARPEAFIRKVGSLTDIKKGIIITVIAADNDIKNVKQFKAAEIIIPVVASK